jgi:transposase-like protein
LKLRSQIPPEIWIRQHGEEAFPGNGHQTPQEEELRQFKRELDLMRQERDILILFLK